MSARLLQWALSPRSVLVVAVLGCLAGALPASASAVPEATPHLAGPLPGVVRAGETIEIRWDGVDLSVEELEIRLSLDGGRHFPIRVSPELDPWAGRFVWRVPNLASSGARLCLRFNRRGREVDGAPSATFRIDARPELPAELEQFHECGWWEGVTGLDVAGPGNALAPTAERLGIGRGSSAIGIETRGPALPQPAAALSPAVAAPRCDESPATLGSYSPSRFVPRRE